MTPSIDKAATSSATNEQRRLRWLAWSEGWSFIVLLLIAMPLKYFAGMPLAVRVVGMVHGVLFVAYLALVSSAIATGLMTVRNGLRALVASLLPAGTLLMPLHFKDGPAKAQPPSLDSPGP